MAVSNLKGVQKTLIDAGSLASRGYVSGKMVCYSDSVTFDGGDAGSTGTVCGTLPTGMIVTGLSVSFAALGSSVTLDIGDSADDNRYADGISAASAGSSDGVILAGMHYVIGTASGDNQLVIKAQDAAATGQVKVTIYGVM